MLGRVTRRVYCVLWKRRRIGIRSPMWFVLVCMCWLLSEGVRECGIVFRRYGESEEEEEDRIHTEEPLLLSTSSLL